MSVLRQPAVAGKFYPGDVHALTAAVNSYLVPVLPRKQALACIAPHAGYIYSGHVAGAVFSAIEVPSLVVVLGPNHTGHGHPLAIMSRDAWLTPLGQVPVAAILAQQLQTQFPLLAEDAEAHHSEHAIEVELPFLQILQPALSFIPIAIGTRNYEVLEALAIRLAAVIQQQSQPVLIVASSDMNHYESDSVTREKDAKALERILNLDARGLFDVVMKEDISMCGLGPAVTALIAANKLGASKAELIKYATSGDVSENSDSVVGYAGVVIA